MSLKDSMGKKRTVLLQNTVMLYLLQFSTYILSFIAVPYETRVLGTEAYGVLGATTAVMVYFQLVIDFGFLLSATEEVSAKRNDTAALRKILTKVTVCKLGLALLSGAVLLLLCRCVGAWRGRTVLFFLFYVSSVFTSLMPDYLYRGMEKMSAITIRTVAIRAFFTVAIYIFLKKPEDLYVVPLLNLIGNGVAMLVAYADLAKRFHITFTKISVRDAFSALRRSSTFFYSRIATTAYTAMNTVILDLISAGGGITGYYTAADKLITTGRSALSPISDSLYPYMARHRDFRLIKKVLLIAMPVIVLFCTGCFIWAEELCSFLLGAEYAPAGKVLRAMLPVGVVTLPSYILGFPTLTAMGLSKYANYSVIFGSIAHIINLLVLYLSGHMNMVTLAILLSVAETIILLFRIAVIWRYRDRLKQPEGENHESAE